MEGWMDKFDGWMDEGDDDILVTSVVLNI